ncbi:PCTP-like protein, partial [Trifolium medium]|nr:PCTP-like protein [Trifolium medium]
REFIVYEHRQTMEDGTVVVAVASLPKEIAAGFIQVMLKFDHFVKL